MHMSYDLTLLVHDLLTDVCSRHCESMFFRVLSLITAPEGASVFQTLCDIDLKDN